jgi:polyisoprenyl-phosphate glycosyltransferase
MAAIGCAILRVWKKVIVRIVRPLRFGITGVINTALGLGVIFAAKALLGLGDLPANMLGYGIGLMASFALNRAWTFRDEGRMLPAIWRFGVAFATAYFLNLMTVFGLRDGLNLNAYAAQAIGVIPYTLFFYVASAYYVFPRRPSYVATSGRDAEA